MSLPNFDPGYGGDEPPQQSPVYTGGVRYDQQPIDPTMAAGDANGWDRNPNDYGGRDYGGSTPSQPASDEQRPSWVARHPIRNSPSPMTRRRNGARKMSWLPSVIRHRDECGCLM
jgi:hypothetical protein